MKYNPIHTVRTLIELFKTGGIQSTAEGDNILLDVRGNLAGDILIFIGPKDKNVAATTDEIMELVRTDSKLDEQRLIVLESVKQKFEGLAFLPLGFVWTLNAIFLYFSFFHLYFDRIVEVIRLGNYPSTILSYLPLILPLLTILFGKYIGFAVLKPILFLIVRLVRLIRMIRNRKVEEMQP